MIHSFFKNITINNVLVCLAFFLYMGTCYPAFWNRYIIGAGTVTVQLTFLLIWACFILPKLKERPNKKFVIWILLSAFLYIVHSALHQDDFAATILYVEIIIVALLAENTFEGRGLMAVFLWFNVIMVISAIIGSVLYYMGILHPIGTEIIIGVDNASMINYGFFLYKSSLEWDSLYIRTGGFYDEPGSMAFINMLLLIYNRKIYKSKVVESILLFGGFVTLSAAHIITTIFYLLFFYVKKGSSQLLFLMSVIAVVVFLYNYESSNPIYDAIKEATFGRVTNVLSGADESRNFDAGKAAFDEYFPFGASTKEIDNAFQATHESIWFFGARFGFIGILFFLPVICLLFRSLKFGLWSDETKYLLLLFINCIQRPNIFFPSYMLIIYFIWFSESHKKVLYDNSL